MIHSNDISDLTAEQQLSYGDEPMLDDMQSTIHTNDLEDNSLRAQVDNWQIPNHTLVEQDSYTQPKIDKGGDKFNEVTGKRGTKATRNNNPGNITGMAGKLLYGAVGFAYSGTGDKGDQSQLIFKTPEEGFKAMDKLARTKYSNGPIRTEFRKWQTDMKSFNNKLQSLKRAGVDINKSYASLDSDKQKAFRKIWSQHEGYRGEFY